MTIKERILAVYRNQMPDRIPFGIYSRYHRSGEIERKARNSGLGILSFFPVVSLLAPPWHVHPGYISEIKKSSFNISYTWNNKKLIEVRSIKTPVGTISQHIIKDPSYGSDWVEKPYINDVEDYKIMQYVVENSVFESQENTITQKNLDLGDDGVLLGRVDRSPYQKLLIELVNPEQFLVDIYINPSPIEELMQTIDSRLDEQFEMVLNSNVDVIWQPDNITADTVPPDLFSKYCLSFYKKNGLKCKQAGKIYTVHIDGKAKSLNEQIQDTPIDVVESFSLPIMGGDLTIEEALELWPDKVICPNFPSSLCLADEDTILNYMREISLSFGDRPYMIQLSEDIDIDKYNYVLNILSQLI
ncbi:MAG: uroporphyrinogen decarboxylase family protein [Bacteroidota bacterium]